MQSSNSHVTMLWRVLSSVETFAPSSWPYLACLFHFLYLSSEVWCSPLPAHVDSPSQVWAGSMPANSNPCPDDFYSNHSMELIEASTYNQTDHNHLKIRTSRNWVGYLTERNDMSKIRECMYEHYRIYFVSQRTFAHSLVFLCKLVRVFVNVLS